MAVPGFETKRLPAQRDAVAPDGSDVRDTVTKNIVIGNAKVHTTTGDGINASPGVIDGGGNVAANNGPKGDPQCSPNIVCRGPDLGN